MAGKNSKFCPYWHNKEPTIEDCIGNIGVEGRVSKAFKEKQAEKKHAEHTSFDFSDIMMPCEPKTNDKRFITSSDSRTMAELCSGDFEACWKYQKQEGTEPLNEEEKAVLAKAEEKASEDIGNIADRILKKPLKPIESVSHRFNNITTILPRIRMARSLTPQILSDTERMYEHIQDSLRDLLEDKFKIKYFMKFWDDESRYTLIMAHIDQAMGAYINKAIKYTRKLANEFPEDKKEIFNCLETLYRTKRVYERLKEVAYKIRDFELPKKSEATKSKAF